MATYALINTHIATVNRIVIGMDRDIATASDNSSSTPVRALEMIDNIVENMGGGLILDQYTHIPVRI